MPYDAAMIGVFDSGLGGLGVLADIRRLEPRADLVALADQAHAPYGDRPPESVAAWTHAATDHLIGLGCDTVVIACNTASTVALASLRAARPDTAFVGMEPAVKPAADSTGTGVIAVLGTTRTIEGPLLASVVERFGAGHRVLPIALPGLVDLIEDGLVDGEATGRLLAARLAPALEAGADTYVLACTHYGFARHRIEEVVGEATVIDPAEAVARQALRVHPEAAAGSGTLALLTTGDPVRMRRQVGLILGWDDPVAPVRLSVPVR